MRVRIFYDRSVHENAAYHYQLAKEAREKLSGLENAIAQTHKEMEEASKPAKKEVRLKRQREWFEKFHNYMTAGGRMLIGGRSAQQNDQLVSKHMEDNDLFFHADIQGGSAMVLKDGLAILNQESGTQEPKPKTQDPELASCAQFAACFSNAWKNGNASVDVYCVRKDQLTKKMSGGFIPSGAFGILGERIWFRDVRLSLRIGRDDQGRIRLLPDSSPMKLKDELVIVPSRSGKEKGALAKSLAKRFKVHPDELLEILPSGKSKTIERKS